MNDTPEPSSIKYCGAECYQIAIEMREHMQEALKTAGNPINHSVLAQIIGDDAPNMEFQFPTQFTIAAHDEAAHRTEVPCGEYTREITAKPEREGLRIDDYALIPWEWIREAYTKSVLDPKGDIRKLAFDPLTLPI